MKDYFIVYEPSKQFRPEFPNSRFFVSPNTLTKYITSKNANKVIETAKKLKTNKDTLKFRKYGKIDIYLK